MSIILALLIFFVAFAVAFVAFRMMIPLIRRSGIVGKDMHKPGQPEVPEMGGLLLITGFTAGVLLAIAFNTFLERFLTIDLTVLLAVLSVVLIATIIGVIDDLFSLRQIIKAIIPLFIALPLVALGVGDTTMTFGYFGQVDFGIIYFIVLIPIGVTGAVNAVNMLAGFNGEETGVGIITLAALAVIAYRIDEITALIILIAGLGALLATLYYNWYPAKIFIGNVGTFSIGAIIASAVIIGNFEFAGLIVIIPYAIDFVIKAMKRFPTSSEKRSWAIYRDGKLYCPESGPVGLGLLIVKLTGGTKERNVTLILMGFEAVCGAFAIWLFW